LFARRLGQLTPGAQLLLAVAAAEPAASKPLAWSVAQRLGADAEPDGELDRLVSFGDGIRFGHPLVRSAAYYNRAISERRRIHGALAAEMDSAQNSDRVAWHLAMSATGPDEAIASKLEQAAQRMRDRGGYAANSALLRRAAALSVDGHFRAGRLLAAAHTGHRNASGQVADSLRQMNYVSTVALRLASSPVSDVAGGNNLGRSASQPLSELTPGCALEWLFWRVGTDRAPEC
jgi:hypothetical protein